MATHAGRKTLRVRDLDVARNVFLLRQSGTEGVPGMMTEEETEEKVKRLEEAMASRKRKRGL